MSGQSLHIPQTSRAIFIHRWALQDYMEQFVRPADAIFIVGDAEWHPRAPDGGPLKTSRVTRVDIDTRMAYTRNSTYMLETPSPEYMDWLEKNSPADHAMIGNQYSL